MKNQTPMFRLKTQLDAFKSLTFISYFELNRKASKTRFGIDESYHSAPITFDFMAVFNIIGSVYRNEKDHIRHDRSFSFCFNFKDCEPTVRAAIKPSKESLVEYSREFSITEIKEKMVNLIQEDIKFTDTFLEHFVSAFEIILSSTLSSSDVKSIVDSKLKEVEETSNNIKRLDNQSSTIRSTMYKIEADNWTDPSLKSYREKLNASVSEQQVLHKSMVFLIKEGTKNIPATPRELFIKELKAKCIVY